MIQHPPWPNGLRPVLVGKDHTHLPRRELTGTLPLHPLHLETGGSWDRDQAPGSQHCTVQGQVAESLQCHCR